MATIDVQVHCYERNHPGRPWVSVLAGPPEVTGADMIKAMDEVGVDGALLISVFAMYRWDASYAVGVHKQLPNRFALIKPVNPNDPKVGETIEEWAKMDGTVAVRIMMNPDVSADPADPGLNRVLATAARLSLPVNLHIAGRLAQGRALIERNPDTQIIVDHLHAGPAGLATPLGKPVLPSLAFQVVHELIGGRLADVDISRAREMLSGDLAHRLPPRLRAPALRRT